jgi:parallel beta-helix repeat protein
MIVCGCASQQQEPDTHVIHVAPKTGDRGNGTRRKPFATLEQARDEIRQIKERDGGLTRPVTVLLAPGAYELAAPFELTDADSGTPETNIEYRAEPGGLVRISGGRAVPRNAFSPVTDETVLSRIDPAVRGSVLQCDLGALGITDLGALDRGALNGGPMLEVFYRGRALPLSRWPNTGWAKYGNVVDPGSVPRWNEKPDRPGTLEYTGNRPERWTDAPEIWLHGYYAFDWYDDVLKVGELDTEAKKITFTTPHTYGLKSGKRYAALNLLEEIDTPGEWMLDRTKGILYLLPPGQMDENGVVLSMCELPLVRMNRTSHVTLRGLTFEYGRGSAVRIAGGTDNLIAGCTVRNMGCGAIYIGPEEARMDGQLRVETGDPVADGRRNGVLSCDIYNVGTSGITLSGGDRRTLTPANHYAVNNDIHHYSRRKRTNCPAIGLEGVGNRAAHNFIHDAPHTGLFYGGNDHLIEFNEAARLCWETGDVGVFYSGRNWTFRGNVVRHNFIHHTIAPGAVGSMGVYLDDSHSSTAVVGNVFYRTDYAAFIGGGRDNLIENNIFVDCRKAVHLDNRSQGWANKYQKPGGDHRMYAKLKEIRHDQPPYSIRFPELARILDENPHEPRGNRVINNLCVRGNWLHTYKGAEQILTLKDNLITADDPGFVDADTLDFSLRPDSPVFDKVPEFKPIPFDKIGLYLDSDRTELPLRSPRIAPDGALFTGTKTVTLACNRPAAEIRYTLDGTDPGPDALLYRGPIALDASATIRAVAIDPDDDAALPSPVSEAAFTKVEFGEGKGVWISDMKPAEVVSHGGLKRDTNYQKNDFITLSGNACKKGILIHPAKQTEGEPSRAAVTYQLDSIFREARRFKATVGVDDAADERGSVTFKVELFRNGAWETAYESPLLRGGPRAEQRNVDVDIAGAEKIRLSAFGGTDVSADHAAFGNARIE